MLRHPHLLPRPQSVRRLHRARQGRLLARPARVASLVYPFSFYQPRRDRRRLSSCARRLPVLRRRPRGQRHPGVQSAHRQLSRSSRARSSATPRSSHRGAPITGHRWRVEASYAPDTKSHERGTRRGEHDLERPRQYVPLTQRGSFAFRLFVGEASGNAADAFYFGGLDTVRGFDFRSLVGDRAFFANLELRFPLIDVWRRRSSASRESAAVLFLDVGGAYFKDGPDVPVLQLEPPQAAGRRLRLRLGLHRQPLRPGRQLGFAKQWDFKHTKGGFATEFWMGSRF